MAKVKVKYKIGTDDYYNPIRYRTKTVSIKLPTTNLGFIKFDTLGENIHKMFKKKIIPSLNVKGLVIKWFEILSYQIISEEK